MADSMLCLQAQFDEIEVLQSIYGDAWKADEHSPGTFSISIEVEDIVVLLSVHLTDQYPLCAPPTYTLSAPSLSSAQKLSISSQLDAEYLEHIGENILYQWIEKIRDFLIRLGLDNTPDNNTIKSSESYQCSISTGDLSNFENQLSPSAAPVPKITHGQVITDRKSSFQGHTATVHTVMQVQGVLAELKSNKKILNATHNMYAYRISLGNSSFAQDCDDDGETHAGGRLLHLLQIVDVKNVVVVVSRWYGGIHLGSDRFRHINNAARQVLEAAQLLPSAKASS